MLETNMQPLGSCRFVRRVVTGTCLVLVLLFFWRHVSWWSISPPRTYPWQISPLPAHYLAGRAKSPDLPEGHGRVAHEHDEGYYDKHHRALERIQADLIPNVGHIVWCGDEKNQFEFHNYISVVSLIKALQPDLIYFHYNSSLPREDEFHYNTWFSELADRFPFLKAVRMKNPALVCSGDLSAKQAFISSVLNVSGGIYLEEHTVLTGFTHDLRKLRFVDALDRDTGSGFVMARIGGESYGHAADAHNRLECKDVSNFTAVEFDFEINPRRLSCVVTRNVFYPVDMMRRADSLGKIVRRLFYNTEDIVEPKPSYDTLIPNIAHIAWVKGGEMNFLFYMGCLSLIYIQEVEMVYIYGDKPPSGLYWDKIKGHPNVTHVYRSSDVTVFNSSQITFLGHVSDIWRLDMVLKYGGIYTDIDVIHSQKLPDRFMGYDAIGSFDWPQYQRPFPGAVSLAPTLGKPGAEFYKQARQTWHRYEKKEFNWNGLRRPYKLWERNPDLLLIEPHLQVICFHFRCHPTWVDGYHDININHVTTNSIKDWRTDTYAFHWTLPCPPEFANETTLLASTGMFAEIGQYVLQRAGLIKPGKNGSWHQT